MWKFGVLLLVSPLVGAIYCSQSSWDTQACCGVGKEASYDAHHSECPNDICDENYCCSDFTSCRNDCLSCPQDTFLNSNTQCRGAECVNATLCCDLAASCTEFATWGGTCPSGQGVDSSLPCSSNCTREQCCREVENCGEAFNAGVMSQSMCYSNVQNVNDPSTSCVGSDCNATVCCKNVTTCPELRVVNATICIGLNQSIDDSASCAGTCTTAECCGPPKTCDDFARLGQYATDACMAMGKVIQSSGSMCTAPGDCGNCCRTPRFCDEVDMVTGGDLSRFCAANYQGFRDSDSCTDCNATDASCCAGITFCETFGNMFPEAVSTCATNGGTFTNSTNCPGGCTPSDCCRLPTCSDVICPPSTRNTYDPSCASSGCNETTCCQLLTCSDARSEAPPTAYGNCNFGALEIFDFEKQCTAGVPCDDAYCCRAASMCSEVPPPLLLCPPDNVVIATKSCSGTGCDVSTCCKVPTTCPEYLGSHPCSPENPNMLNRSCAGPCDIGQCCGPPLHCSQFDPSFCSPVELVNKSKGCNGPCGAGQCCEQITSCFEADASRAGAACQNQGKLFDSAGSIANGCCKQPTSCDEANYVANDQLTKDCNAMDKVISGTQACSTNCSAAVCCRAANFCAEYYAFNQQGCGRRGLMANLSVGPFDRCNNGDCSSCCQPATDCNQLTYCPPGTKNSYESNCAPNCGIARCCLPETCGEVLGHCQNGGEYLERQKQCPTDGSPCDYAYCCHPPVTCGQAGYGCPPGKVLDTDKACSGDNCGRTDYCCHAPTTCNEFNAPNNGPSPCDAVRQVPVNSSTPCNGPCNEAQCCKQPRSCLEAPASYCSGLTTLNPLLSCPGGMCNETICCVTPMFCTQISDLPRKCAAMGQTVVPGGQLFSLGCCKNITSCYEWMEVVSESSLICYANNKVPDNNKPCSGANCSVATCCREPNSCDEYKDLYSDACDVLHLVWNESDPKFSAPCSTQPCNEKQCCRKPMTCGDRDSSGGNNPCPDGSGVPKSGDSPCSNCDERDCCRPPQNCLEAADADRQLCFGMVPKNASCSGATCNKATCCQPAPTCEPLLDEGLSFQFCAVAGKTPDYSKINFACPGNACTADHCCKVPTNCSEAYIINYACPLGKTYIENKACVSGTTCNAATCCGAPKTCEQFFMAFGGPTQQISQICGANAFPDFNSGDKVCVGDCTAAQCCKPFDYCPTAAYIAGICNGVGYTTQMPCNGSAGECVASRCCRPPTTCRGTLETVNPGLCGTMVADPNKALEACAGNCPASTCCKTATTCGEKKYQCPAGRELLPNADCGGSCSDTKCCGLPATCNSVRDTVCDERVELFNSDKRYAACPCDHTTCCTKYATCLDAVGNDPAAFCGADMEPNVEAVRQTCTDCKATCCMPSCPAASLRAFFTNCTSGDFPNLTFNCSETCKTNGVALLDKFRRIGMTVERFLECFNAANGQYPGASGAPPRFADAVKDFLNAQIRKGEICGVSTVSAAPAFVSVWPALLSVLALFAL